MPRLHASDPPDAIVPSPFDNADEQERRLIEAVVALARSLRDERDRLAKRLHEVEQELNLLASKLETRD